MIPKVRTTTGMWPLKCLKMRAISAEGVFPMCQDTGTAIVMEKRGNKSGPGVMMKKPFQKGSLMPIPPKISGIPRTPPLICMKKKIPGAIFRPRSNCMPKKGMNIIFCLSQKEGDRPIKPICFKKQRPYSPL